MSGDREERNRALGFPVDRHPSTRPAREPQVARPQHKPQVARPQHGPQAAQPPRRTQAEEPQRVLGFPVDGLGEFANEVLRPLLRRIRGGGRK